MPVKVDPGYIEIICVSISDEMLLTGYSPSNLEALVNSFFSATLFTNFALLAGFFFFLGIMVCVGVRFSFNLEAAALGLGYLLYKSYFGSGRMLVVSILLLKRDTLCWFY